MNDTRVKIKITNNQKHKRIETRLRIGYVHRLVFIQYLYCYQLYCVQINTSETLSIQKN